MECDCGGFCLSGIECQVSLVLKLLQQSVSDIRCVDFEADVAACPGWWNWFSFLWFCLMSQLLNYLCVFAVLKGIVHSKIKTAIIYSLSCHSKPDYISFEKQSYMYSIFHDCTLLYKQCILQHACCKTWGGVNNRIFPLNVLELVSFLKGPF